jgi:cytochrome P450
MDTEVLEQIPDHVRPDQVVDYDYWDDPRLDSPDVQLDMHELHSEAPDIFYTPRNGGFWVATRYELQEKVLRDDEHFSNRIVIIPRDESPYVMIPLNLDPPDHLPYRMTLMRHFDQKRIRAMEPFIREWANRLIDPVVDKGACEFVEQIAAPFPVSVFMELMGMPLERFDEYRAIAEEFFLNPTIERRIELQGMMIETMDALFEQKRADPKDDLMSRLVQEEVRGKPLSREELRSIGFLLFLAGLDTVTNTLSFTFRHLASRPDLQDRLRANPEETADFVEEALRRNSIVNQPRLVIKDVELGGAQLRANDMIVCPLALAGMDDRRNPNPEEIEIHRKNRAHLAFATGPHTCIGNFLARTEMRVMIEEWLKRIPRFSLDPESKIGWRSGGVMAIYNLQLRWE